MQIVGFIFIAFFGLTGFIIGTFKFPKIGAKKFGDLSGEKIDDIILRYMKFQKKKNTVYVQKNTQEEVTKDE